MKNNIGNTMFAYGPTVNLPSADPKAGMMTPDMKLFMIQPIDPAAPANFTGYNGPSMNWCISGLGDVGQVINPRAKQTGWTVGYYVSNFRHRPSFSLAGSWQHAQESPLAAHFHRNSDLTLR